MDDRPLFEVTTPAATAAARRLTTAAAVAAIMDAGDVPSDTATTESHIDIVSAMMARVAGLASDGGANIPTFAAETLRATWFAATFARGDKLLLPWRVPVTSITSVVEDGVTLTPSDDYRLLPGAALLRLDGDGETPAAWLSAKIIVNYIAGWASLLSTNAPPELSAACAEQVKYRILSIERDPSVRSESVPDVYSASYAIAGGDNVAASGLLLQVQSALAPYRNISV
mgnify:FL=1